MSKAKKISVAKMIGAVLAWVQSAFDDLLAFLFKKLKNIGEHKKDVEITPPNPTPVEELEDAVIKGAKSAARFVGELGESYYDTYEEIKKKK